MDLQTIVAFYEALPKWVHTALAMALTGGATWVAARWRYRQALVRLERGDSDDIISSAHYLLPAPAKHIASRGEQPAQTLERFCLCFRTVGLVSTVDRAFDNEALRQLARDLVSKSSIATPILRASDEKKLGYEMVKTLKNLVVASLSTSPYADRVWLMVVTCEDRELVDTRCLRIFLIRPEDLERFRDWNWVKTHIMVEKPWHWPRVHSLHKIATTWEEQKSGKWKEDRRAGVAAPISSLAMGLKETTSLSAQPREIDWNEVARELRERGIADSVLG